MQPRARAVTLTNVLEVARFVQLDPFAMLGRAGLHPSALHDPENWIPARSIINLIEDCAHHSGRDDFGILLGQCRTFASLGPVALLLRHAPTLHDAITALIEFRHLLNELLYLELRSDGETAILEWSLIPELRSTQAINLVAAIAYRVLVDGPGFDWQPDCVHFRQSPPRHVSTFQRLMPCPLQFDSSFDGMSFRTDQLQLANRHAEPGLAIHARRLLNLLPGIRRGDSMVDRTRATIAMLIANGSAQSSEVARLLGISVRSLQRGLEAERRTFSALVNEVRRDLAVRYLGDTTQSISAIAHLSGYSSLSSFTHWFTSEFGMSPRKWRALINTRDARHFASHSAAMAG
jgi:AraC-like DNA-binding protein